MLALNAKNNGIRILLPKEFIHPEVEKKYTNVLRRKRSFFTRPIDFINETIQKVDILGFNNAALQQRQTGRGYPLLDPSRVEENNFMHTNSEYSYRSEVSPIELIDKTLNIEFRHTLGFLNYIILFENFWYLYCRDMQYKDMVRQFKIELFDELGSVFCIVEIDDPVINGMDMISFDYSQPVTNMSTFKIEFKYSNFDFVFPDRYYDDAVDMPINNDKILNNSDKDINTNSLTVTPINAVNKTDTQIILDDC